MGTSGTTREAEGRPNPAPLSLLHYCNAFAARVGGADTLGGVRMASVTTLAADLGNTMVFPSLLFGGVLHLMPAATIRDPRLFEDYVQEHRIDGRAEKSSRRTCEPCLTAGPGCCLVDCL